MTNRTPTIPILEPFIDILDITTPAKHGSAQIPTLNGLRSNQLLIYRCTYSQHTRLSISHTFHVKSATHCI